MDEWIATLQGWMHAAGPWGYLVLFFAALIEYVFPPFPGDTVVLLGGAYAALGERHVALVIAAVTLGSGVGIALLHRVGVALGRGLAHRTGSVLGISHQALERAQVAVHARGDALLVLNRFLPSFRALVFVAAGASSISLPRALVLGTVSAALWNALLVSAGYVVGDNLARIDELFTTYRRLSFVLLGLLGLGVGAWAYVRRRQARRAP